MPTASETIVAITWINAGHVSPFPLALSSTCFYYTIVHAFAEVPSQPERDKIMEQLTKLREDVEPEATNMNLLSYSKEMERVAETWVTRCEPDYPGSKSLPSSDGGYESSYLQRNLRNANEPLVTSETLVNASIADSKNDVEVSSQNDPIDETLVVSSDVALLYNPLVNSS
uniref:SCP domain-containing protein n=1 Tax=Mesocestoides corti TaxID=53468 RepID=A0A5K3G1M2_MESCO